MAALGPQPPSAGPPPSQFPYLPRLADPLLTRERLLARLDEWAPITVVRGPAGTGKTTLVASWLAAQPAGTVDGRWLAGPVNSADIEALRGQLTGAADPKVVLVLDGLDGTRPLDPSWWPPLLAVIEQHRNSHLIVCCAGHQVIDAVGAAAANVITTRELLFDRGEVGELARLARRELTSEQLDRLCSATGGWPAAVRMVLDAMTDADRELPEVVAARWLKSLLAGATGADSDLMRFALAEYLDSDVIAGICGERAAATITALDESGLVDRRHRGRVEVFEYPALVRDALRAAYVDRDPEQARRFHGRLAAWFARDDRVDYALPALRHAVAARDWPLATQIWDRRGLSIAARSPDRLRTILRDVPRDVLDERSALRAYANASAADHPADLDSTLRRQASRCLRLTNEQLGAMPLGDLLFFGAGKVIGQRGVDGDLAATVALIDRVSTEVATSTETSSLGELIAWFELNAATTMALVGEREEALKHYHVAAERADDCGADFILARAAGHLALNYAITGHNDLAARWLTRRDHTIDRGRCSGRDGLVAARVATGLIALDGLDGDAVAATLDGLDDVALRHELWPYLSYLRAQHALHYGEPATALTRLAATQRSNIANGREPHGVAAELLARARADLLISLGQGQRAHGIVSAAAGLGPLLDVPTARLCLQSGDYEQARLRAGRSVYAEWIGPRDQLELLIINSVAALRAGDPDAAGELFAQALAGSLESGILRVFATVAADELTALAELCVRGRPAEARPAFRQVLASLPADGHQPVYRGRLVLISLTKSERALIEALERTGSRRDIAEARHVSLNTIKTQLRALYQKLGTSSRHDTLARVRELGLLA